MGPLRLRRGYTRDAREVAAVHVAAWKAAYPGLVDQGYLDGLSPLDHVDGWWRRLATPARNGITDVALIGERVVGFVVYGPSRDPDAPPRAGELYSLYVHPDAWGRGVGKALYARCCRALRIAGCEELTLWAMTGHARSRSFYEARGLRADGATKRDEPPGGVILALERLRGPLGEPEDWWTAGTLRRAALRALAVGLAFGAFPGLFLLLSGELRVWLLLMTVGATAFLPSLVEARWRARGRPTLGAALLAGLGALVTLAALVVSFGYASEVWRHGSVAAAIQGTLGFAQQSGLWALFTVLGAPWTILLAVGALGDLEEWTGRTLEVAAALTAIPAGGALLLAAFEGPLPLALLAAGMAWGAGLFAVVVGAAIVRLIYGAADFVDERLWPELA